MLDYYWREYKGAIPQDAVVAGQDGRSQKAYIGQAYVKGFGLMVIHIRPNAKELYAPICGVKNVNEHIKVSTKLDNHYHRDTFIFRFFAAISPILNGFMLRRRICM